MVLDHVDHLIGQDQSHIDLGIVLQEVEHDGLDMHASEHDRRRQQHVAARDAVFAARDTLGLAQLLQHAPAAGDIGAARFRQQELTAGSHDELRAQMRLKIRHTAADGGQGIPSVREAAERLPPSTACNEGAHGFEAVH